MKITILSRSASIASTRRLVEAGRARGHRVRVLNPVKVQMHLDGKSANLFYQHKRMPPGDVVIPRIAQSVNVYGLAVVNQLAMRGVPLLNSAEAIAQSRNKMRSLQLLSARGVDIPATVMARDAAELREMVGLVGGVPVLVKLLQGQERRGIMICESLQSLEATLEAVLGLGHNLIVQQYVKRADQDMRVLVVGGEAVAAVRRRPRVGRLSQTLNAGARLERITLPEPHRKAAEAAARLMGLEVAAVDMLDLKGAPKVFEVNSSPALHAMEEATGVDVATPVILRAEALARRAPPAEALPRPLSATGAGEEAPAGGPARGRRASSGRR
jgi:ribosomal protein S6--L-glutamate ligase